MDRLEHIVTLLPLHPLQNRQQIAATVPDIRWIRVMLLRCVMLAIRYVLGSLQWIRWLRRNDNVCAIRSA